MKNRFLIKFSLEKLIQSDQNIIIPKEKIIVYAIYDCYIFKLTKYSSLLSSVMAMGNENYSIFCQ
jgi:hypothetical protein